MPEALEFHSRVGPDGVLDVHVPLGTEAAGREVVVTVRRLPATSSDTMSPTAWHEFVDGTYGSCAHLDLERHDQGTYEQREAVE